ncbi:hypothetical protein U3653_32100 [Nocardia sp. CDC186]|uniref:Helix-turn-helix domain-containing protein n=1 Tax=Nocardia implantans TaxID=3108168 RepID=A0ABU6B5Q3_9NOCA|nr:MULTISPECIES: hypothetical protein [unclassified Nocardia]MEA3532817.1 hypothetical protein [Nocardia sp. CDC192]MEB3514689.1 hypothetical protein [Nocardia sp. CDC186]
MIGWQAYDSGDTRAAADHYEVARTAADAAADPALTALVLCNASLAATRGGDPGLGVDHAAAAHWWATQSRDRLLTVYALHMAAEAQAERGDARQCRSTLDEANDLIDSADSTPPATAWPDDKIDYTRLLREQGNSLGEIPSKTGIPKTSLHRYLTPTPEPE